MMSSFLFPPTPIHSQSHPIAHSLQMNPSTANGEDLPSENTASASHPASESAESTSAGANSPTHHITYRQHVIDVSKLTYPIILSEVFQNSLPVVDVAFVGQLGKNELAAAALATVWFDLWHSATIGWLTATDTFLSQCYGANQLDNYAIWTGNSLIITIFTTIVVSGAVALCAPCMKLFGQHPDLADAAGEFSYRLIPGLFPLYLFKVLTKYLQTQNLLGPGVWIGVLANAINALFNWGLIYAAGWGLVGAPWATSLTRLAEFLVILLYMFTNKKSLKDTWPVFSRVNMKYSVLKPFWKLAISGALSFSAEAWSFEITTILAGLLGTVALDAHMITLTISTFIFLSFPFAVGIAASIRVGQLVGEQKPLDAQRSSHTSFFISATLQVVLIAIIVPCRDLLGNLFSSDEEVAYLVSQLIPISFVFMMGDAIQSCAGGVLRGLGRQKLVLMLNILGFWILAVPIGSILAFVAGVGVFGFW